MVARLLIAKGSDLMLDERPGLLSRRMAPNVFVRHRHGARCLVRLTSANGTAERELSERERREDTGQTMTYAHA